MKQKTVPILIFVILFSNFAFTQPNRSPEKIKQDSIESVKFRKDNPELFQNKRIPITLIDGNYYIKGFRHLGIRIVNNHIVDSVNHNFHLGSTETGIIPYNSVHVTDENISIDLISSEVFTDGQGADSATITKIDASSIKNGKIEGKLIASKGWKLYFMDFSNSKKNYDSIHISPIPFKGDSTEIRISINGKLLFDWIPLNKFQISTYYTTQKWSGTNKDKKLDFWVTQYTQGYHIADEHLKINDQLLIEIKNDFNGWMMDRFNFTRVAASPVVSSIIPTDEQNKVLGKENTIVTLVEKKTSY